MFRRVLKYVYLGVGKEEWTEHRMDVIDEPGLEWSRGSVASPSSCALALNVFIHARDTFAAIYVFGLGRVRYWRS